MLAATSITNMGVLPLFLYTPVRLGGIGFNTAQIGKALSGQAITTSCVQLFLFPAIHRRLGSIATYRLAVIFYPLGFAFYPITKYIASRQSGGDTTWIWVSLAVQLGFLSLANMVSVSSGRDGHVKLRLSDTKLSIICPPYETRQAYSVNMLLVNASAPTHLALGTLNGGFERSLTTGPTKSG